MRSRPLNIALSRRARIALFVSGGFLFAFALAAGSAVLALRAGPVSVGFLTPYLESAAEDAAPGLSVSVEDTVLIWGGWERGFDVRASGVRIDDEDGGPVAEMPEVAVTFSAAALLEGRFALNRVDFLGPELFIRRSADGRIAFSFDGSEDGGGGAPGASGGGFADFIAGLGADTPSGAVLEHLEAVSVTGGGLSVFDARTGRVWTAPFFNAALSRSAAGPALETDMILDLDGRSVPVKARGAYVNQTGGVRIGFEFENLRPSALAEFDPVLAPLAGAETDLSGAFTAVLAADGAPETAEAEITAAAGSVRVNEDIKGAFKSAALKARWSRAEDSLLIESFDVDFGKDGKLDLPGTDFALPAAAVLFKGGWRPEAGSFDITKLTLDMAGPVMTASGQVTDIGGPDMAISVKTATSWLPVAGLQRYWPPGFAPDARVWAEERMKAGRLENITVEADIKRSGDGFAPVRIDGVIKLSDVTVIYAEGMEPVTGAAGTARLSVDRIDTVIESGDSAGLRLTGGEIALTGLDGDSEQADIRLDIAGPARNAVTLIDGPGLRFASAVGLSADRIEGDAFIDLSLKFPLLEELTWDDMAVTARAFITDMGVKDAALGLDLKDAAANLTADNNGLDVSADGLLGDFPVRFSWRENFSRPRAFKARYAAEARTDDITKVSEIGVNIGIFGEGAVTGPAAADVIYIQHEDGESQITVDADLSETVLDFSALAYHKPAGAAAEGSVTLDLKDGRLIKAPAFAFSAEEFKARGGGEFGPDGGFSAVRLSEFQAGRTDVSADLRARQDGGWDVSLSGAALDLSPAWSGLTGADGGGEEDGEDALPEDTSLSVGVSRVWLDDENGLEEFSGVFTRADGVWRTMFAESGGEGDMRFTLRLAPGGNNRRILTMKASNAGAVLDALGIYENMRGGELELQGVYDDTQPDPPLKGSLTVKNYRIVGLPWLAELASVMALTGIVESIGGEGLAFSELSMPFERTGDATVINEGRASGLSLGITVSGTVYQGAEALNLNGVIVPAFLVNNILTEIPLLGTLLSGGEEGGGVFAAKYTVTGPAQDPEVSVNPLSTLAPGFLRNVFGVFDQTPPAPEAE